jgi:DNA mismatch endonuclease (patch repair protein)
MADIVSPAVRSRMMSGIRGRDTKPELMLRKGLHAAGFRYRLHVKDLPGKPDMVFPRYRAVLFAHGCFWHGHGCHLFRWPSSRQDWWREKITRNSAVDARSEAALAEAGWRLGVVWECALKGRTRLPLAEVLDACVSWLCSQEDRLEIRGTA